MDELNPAHLRLANIPMKLLIINADDFGVTEGVNRAVLAAYHAGAVSSASLMANMPAFENAVSLAKSEKGLGVGVHLTLASGDAILPKHAIPSLVEGNGRLPSRRSLIIGLLTKRISLADIEKELRAQIDAVRGQGIAPDHLDGDKHVHILPGVREITVTLAKELDVPVRIPNEQIILNDGIGSLFSKRALSAIIALQNRKSMALDTKRICLKRNIKCNDKFISIFGLVPRQAPENRYLAMLLDGVSSGVTEMMVHPGYHDPSLQAFYGEEYLSRERELELKCLVDPVFMDAVKRNGITIGSYKSV